MNLTPLGFWTSLWQQGVERGHKGKLQQSASPVNEQAATGRGGWKADGMICSALAKHPTNLLTHGIGGQVAATVASWSEQGAALQNLAARIVERA